MPRFISAHRGKPDQHRSKRYRDSSKDTLDEDGTTGNDADFFIDDSPRELLAMGAVLDHLCQGGRLSDSTRVFMREASRGRRCLNYWPEQHGLLDSHFSCLSVCSKPHEGSTFNANYAFPDDDDVDDGDDGYTIPTAVLRRFREDSKEDEDYTMSFEDLTFDEVTLETFDEYDTIAVMDIEAVMRATRKVWENIDPHERLHINPAFMEHAIINEGDIDEELLGAIAMNASQLEENLQELVSNPQSCTLISPAVLFGLSFDQADDNKSINSLAKKMHGILKRNSSKLFATSDTKGNGQKAVVVRRRGQKERAFQQPALRFSIECENDDNLTFAECQSDESKEDPSMGLSTFNTNCASILANAPKMAWPPTFPLSREFRHNINSSEPPKSVMSSLTFVPHDNTEPGSAVSLSSSRTTTTPSETIVLGNGSSRRVVARKNRFIHSPTRMVGKSIFDGEDRFDSTTVSSLSVPSFSDRIVSVRPWPTPSSGTCRRGNRNSHVKDFSNSSANTQKKEGILAPLARNEILGTGFEVQQVEQRRLEI
ncbi:hypothetical protein IV203_025840 [Nitzschia inconspicua]|uniref:Uncharacterized protein n=1 Tax=Nitzschia inconspicua TaxID=303405 RepID=A0A9K3PYV0_9STRA|nr:hypothetical protein IV203_017688 [Nitzschia inconspicua]KAG7362174.1 hypothetical protein IV203_025840 [Nitzschia inconspicua]